MKNFRRLGLLSLVITIITALTIPLVAANANPSRCAFSGTVLADGSYPPPAGTKVSAWTDNAGPWNTAIVEWNGLAYYYIAIPYNTGNHGAQEGDTIYFSVGDITAQQTATFRTEGHYSVPLTIWTITHPIAEFGVENTIAEVGQEIQFTNYSCDAAHWYWDFESDGIIDSTQPNPTHAYEKLGTYSVTLTINNAYGEDSITKTSCITVCSLAQPLYEGWNLITFTDTTRSLIEATSSISNYVQSVWQLDNQNKDWIIWKPNTPTWSNELTTLNQSQPYFIRVKTDCIWTL